MVLFALARSVRTRMDRATPEQTNSAPTLWKWVPLIVTDELGMVSQDRNYR